MVQICICDDEPFQAAEYEKYILDYAAANKTGQGLDVDVFNSGADLIKQIEKNKEEYQIAFLDMEMPEMNGIETAKRIRLTDKDMIIVYVTSYEKYTLESFEVSPFRYLIKPVGKEKFQKVLEQALSEIMLKNQYLFFKIHGKQYQVKYDNIISVTSEKGRVIRIRTSNSPEDLLFYGKIKDLEKMLNPYIFVKINPGTIVNFNYVYIVDRSDIKLVTDETLPISRSQKNNVKKGYNEFIKRKIGV